jgi:hypothetical protein
MRTKPRGKVRRLRDDPDPGLRSRGAGDDAGDVVGVHGDGVGGQRADGRAPSREEQGGRECESQLARIDGFVVMWVLRWADCANDTRRVHEMMRANR